MGGNLSVVAQFPDREPVRLSGMRKMIQHRSPQADDTRWRNRRLLNAVMLESEQLVRRGTVGFIPRNPPDQMVGS